ncbi:hypothetical protein HMPREF9425_1403 [Streptococcus vestibularis ATCC 49124]|uniref:Uncharacterized protein n=2 Tax=Streptococcus vestibularis TaxID=1343 RepID=E3CTE3_STRVE|nr:hypothetical protein HMPREF9192_0425 [Streptococcus vestibularis F0396]EFX95687.1 hypothetical protein HMPREF9425_1403 [Streptococcus vestibularis ATCC 49124]
MKGRMLLTLIRDSCLNPNYRKLRQVEGTSCLDFLKKGDFYVN